MEKTYFSVKQLCTLFFLCFSFFTVQSQCAGTDTAVTICNIEDPVNNNLNLFNLLNGNPQTGGSWVDVNNTNIFINQAAGTVNLWNLPQGGTYQFEYVITDAGCTDQESTITLTIGGYPGINNYSANACETESSINLFQFIGSSPNPNFGGTWNDISMTGALSNNFYNASTIGVGTFTFTYVVPALGSCPERLSTVELTVHPKPEPGTALPFDICGIDDIADYSNVDLFDYLSGHDPNGVWTELSGTSELASPTDTFINVENIYNTLGYGVYEFEYTVFPTHPICSEELVVVVLNLQRIVDFTGADLQINSICEGDTGGFTVTVGNLPGTADVPNFQYSFEYTINGPVNYTGIGEFTPGAPSFDIPSDFNPTPGTYTLNIIDLTILNDTNMEVCGIIWDFSGVTFEVTERPDLINATLSADDICIGDATVVTLTDAFEVDGDYTITYVISGANNSTHTIPVTIQNGSTSFVIDPNFLPNSGTTTITITFIEDDLCGEDSDVAVSFEIFPLPDISSAVISIDNVCLGEPVVITILNLSGFQQLLIEYNITGANVLSNMFQNLTVINNEAQFTLPEGMFPNSGLMNFEIIHVTDLTSGCENQSAINTDFEIYSPPAPPSPQAIQEFCETEQPTVAELVPQGSQYTWYNNDVTNEPLNTGTALINGTYYLSITDGNGCESDREAVAVIINEVPPVGLITDGENFCGADLPTIIDLNANANVPGGYDIVWHDSNGNILIAETLLINGVTYYAHLYDEVTDCSSYQVLEIEVSLTDCDEDDITYDFFIPDAFSPNGDNINDTFRILNIQYIYPDYEYEIYNRYGKLLFIGNRNKPEWDGYTSEGSALQDGIAPNGVYFYILKFNKNNKQPQQGRVYLNR